MEKDGIGDCGIHLGTGLGLKAAHRRRVCRRNISAAGVAVVKRHHSGVPFPDEQIGMRKFMVRKASAGKPAGITCNEDVSVNAWAAADQE